MGGLDQSARHQAGTLPADSREDAQPIEPFDPTPFQRGDHVELAERLVAFLKAKAAGNVVADEGEVAAYGETGIWRGIDQSELSRIVQRFAGQSSGPKGEALKLRAADVAGAIKLATDQVTQPGFFSQGPKGIAFKNGFVQATASGAVVHRHAPENRARFVYPFAYEKLAPVQFMAFLESIWRDDEDKNEKIQLLQEFCGVCLVGDAPRYQRAIVGKGKGANGKSATVEILTCAMPPGSTVAIAPQDLDGEYRRAMLAGKRLNVVSELPEADILSSEAFKAIISGVQIVGRHIRGAPFTFAPIAGHLLLANALPGTNDLSHGFWRRLIVLSYNRIFTDDPQRNPNIAKEIVEAELPAIVAWFIEGAVRLMREKEYTIPASHAQALEDWRRSADQMALFVEEGTRPLSPEESLGEAAADLYAAYRAWATTSGHRPLASNRFAARMKELGKGAVHTRVGNRYPVVASVKAGDAKVKASWQNWTCGFAAVKGVKGFA